MANVIKTVLTYPLDGSTTDFNIPFEYLARKFVVATLLGVDRRVLTLTTDYRFATRTVIATNKAWGPADGYTQIEIRRVTSATERLVDFTDGSILRAYDLNVAQIQTMHVAEEARNMTADTIGVNNDGHLDARGRRIVNLANAVDDRDAVPFGQLKALGQGAWQSRNEALQFRNEAEQFKNQAATSRTAAETARSQAETSKIQSEAAKTASETARDRAIQAQSAASASATAAGQHEQAAEAQAANSLASASRSKTEADRAESEADRAQQAVQDVKDTGAVPVGTIAMFGNEKIPAGWISLMEDDPIFDVNAYPDLARLYPTGHLPSYKDRVPEGIGSGITLGQKRAGNVGQTGIIQLSTSVVDISHDHDFSGSTTYGGAHEHFVNSLNQRSDSGVYPTVEYSNWRSPNLPNWTKTGIGGAHSHSFSGRTAGMRGGINQTHSHAVSGTVGSGRNLVDATGTIFAIKAAGAVSNAGLMEVTQIKQDVAALWEKVRLMEARA